MALPVHLIFHAERRNGVCRFSWFFPSSLCYTGKRQVLAPVMSVLTQWSDPSFITLVIQLVDLIRFSGDS